MKTEKQKSPVIGDRVIKKLLNEEEYLEKTGDIDEVYFELLESDGRSRAALWYWSEIIKTIISILLIRFAGSIAMFKNYLKIAFRNIIRNKVYSLLNILGLSIGIAGCVLILIYVKYEFSFDQYHENPDSIYRVYMEFPDYYRGTNLWAGTCGPLAKTLVEEYPEVIAAARLETKDEVLISYGAKKFMEDNIIFADPEIFDVFSFELLEGNPKSVLDDPYSIIVSEKMAEKYFGKENPIGKILNFDIKYDFRITGILKNMPANSHFNMDFIIPFQVHKTITGIPFSSWYQSGLYTYILLEENASPVELEAKLPALLNKYWDGRGEPDDKFHLQLMTDIHLHSNMLNEFQANNDIKYIYLLTGIAVLIIFIACFNYMNLATARSFHRAKEVGIRKVVGAQRIQLIRQFFGESFILTIFGFILALAMVYLVLPEFNSFVERDLTLTVKDIINNAAWLVLLIISVSIISGSYPALFITSFKPVLVLKGALKGSSRGELLRNILVVSQFVITITLIISSIMIQQQLSFIKNKDLGLNKDRIVTVFLHNDQTRNNIGVVKNELTENPGIISVASSRALLFNGMSQGRADWPEKVDKEEFLPIYINSVDYDFLDMYGIEITEGRNFSREFASDAGGAFLLNESAIEMIGFEDPIGRDFIQAGHFGRNDGKIVGVMKDFHFQSLRLNIEPIQLILNEEEANRYLSIKIKAENIPETLGFIEDKIGGFSPNYPFEYTFFDEIFDRAYKTEQKLGQIMSVFSTLAIIVACLGLLGLSSFITEQRMKEIGIRKVLGASFNKIIFLLSGEFSKWIILANIISIPIAYFTMNKWLENYAYKIEISPITFLMGALAVILIALITVSFHSVRAALTKTVNSLRYE
ncbi:MAG: FtsX-like permease family protein [bacterium]|nr:FtsX-like permease family protein [bacterium]